MNKDLFMIHPNMCDLKPKQQRILYDKHGDSWRLFICESDLNHLAYYYLSDQFGFNYNLSKDQGKQWLLRQIEHILDRTLWESQPGDLFMNLFLDLVDSGYQRPPPAYMVYGDMVMRLENAFTQYGQITNRHLGRCIELSLLKAGIESNPGPGGPIHGDNLGGVDVEDNDRVYYVCDKLQYRLNRSTLSGRELIKRYYKMLDSQRNLDGPLSDRERDECLSQIAAYEAASYSSANGSVEVETLESGQLASPILNSAVSPVLSHEDLVRLSECLCTLQSIYTAFGFVSEKKDFHAVVKTLEHWAKCASECGWLAFAKYKFTAFYSAWAPLINEDMPDKPFREPDLPHMLIGGRFGRFIQKYLSPSGQSWSVHRKHEFLSSILYAKKGMPRVGTDVLDVSAKQMALDLTKAPTEPVPEVLLQWADITEEHRDVELLASRATVKDQLRRTVREIFGKKEESLKGVFRNPVAPSFSANYNNTRGVLGTVGYLRDLEFELMNSGFFGKGAKGKFDHVSESEALNKGYIEEQIDQDCRDLVFCRDYHDIRQQYDTVLAGAIRRAWREAPVVEPVPLAEPFKVRVISKGPPDLYYVLKSIQRHLWSILRRNERTFKLIGEPCTPEILKTLIGVPKNQKDDKFLLSVDYKAATDGLFSFVSETIADEVCNLWGLALDSKLRQMLHRSLTGHVFPTSLFTQEELSERELSLWGDAFVPQLNGQLMGSVTSFPFLCIANAAILRWAKEIEAKRRLSLNQAMIAINGDDAATWTGRVGFEAWSKLMKHFGFKASPGKVYCSREFVNINSTTYRVVPEGYVHVRYLNMGLLKGLKRSEGGVGLADVTGGFASFGSRARELMASLPDGLERQVYRMFIREHWDLLSKVGVPWYIDESYGGVGLPPQYEYEYHGDDMIIRKKLLFGPTDADRRGCRMIHCGMVDPVKIVKDPSLSGVFEALMDLLPDIKSYYLPRGINKKEDSPSLGKFQVALFYCRLDSVLRNPTQMSMDAWMHNRKVWQTCFQRCRELGVFPFEGEILSYTKRLGCTFVDPNHVEHDESVH